MLIRKYQIAGFTLTELLMALVVNMVILAALISLFVANLNHYTTFLATNHLSQQMQPALDLMVADIRRAGYWANAISQLNTDQNTNPFQSIGTTPSSTGDIQIGSTSSTTVTTSTSGTPDTPGYTTVATGNCILFTYDHASSGPSTLPAISSSATSDDDYYGYAYAASGSRGMLQVRPWGKSFSCGATDWANLTDSAINITALTFTLTSIFVSGGTGGSAGLNMRSVDIVFTGNLVSNTAITKTLNAHIRIRNDYFVP